MGEYTSTWASAQKNSAFIPRFGDIADLMMGFAAGFPRRINFQSKSSRNPARTTSGLSAKSPCRGLEPAAL
jgi:hypothetical protein